MRSLRPIATPAPGHLPAPVSGEAVLAQRRLILVLGGLDGSDVSTDAVVLVNPASGRANDAGGLAEARHDTAAAEASERTLIFGGGSMTELDSVESLSPRLRGSTLGKLPTARSDLSAVGVGTDAYLLGGYDGSSPVAEVLRTSDGRRYATAARLPVAFRYAAVAVVGQRIFTFGGELANGEDSNAIQMLDTATEQARIVGHLSRAISHASAVVLAGKIYILGGRSNEAPLRQIVAFDPRTSSSHLAGRLPLAVTNAAATQIDETGYLIGGLTTGGRTLDSVIEIHLQP